MLLLKQTLPKYQGTKPTKLHTYIKLFFLVKLNRTVPPLEFRVQYSSLILEEQACPVQLSYLTRA